MEKEKFPAISYKVSIEMLLDVPENSQEEEITISLVNEEWLDVEAFPSINLPPIKIPKTLVSQVLPRIENMLRAAINYEMGHIHECANKFSLTHNIGDFSLSEHIKNSFQQMLLGSGDEEFPAPVQALDAVIEHIRFATVYDSYYQIAIRATKLFKQKRKSLTRLYRTSQERADHACRTIEQENKDIPKEVLRLLGIAPSEIAFECTANYFHLEARDSNGNIRTVIKDRLAKGRELLPHKDELLKQLNSLTVTAKNKLASNAQCNSNDE